MFEKLSVRDQVLAWVDRAIDVQDGALRAALAQAGGGDGPRTGEQTAAALETQYLATVSGAGAVVGGAAMIPGVGTGLAVGLSVAETVAFLDATALFALTTAQARGFTVRDLPRRRALLLTLLLGEDALGRIPAGPDGSADRWGERLLALDDAAVDELNRSAEKWLVTRFGPRQGMFIVGRLMPFGIGAAIGAAGNALTAKGVIARLRSAFAGSPASSAVPGQLATHVSRMSPESTPSTRSAEMTPSQVQASTIEPPTGKYTGLYSLLASIADDEAVLSVADLEAVVTGGFPAAARQAAGWWGNDATAARAPQTRAWLAAGLQVSEVDLTGEKVRFTRAPAVTTA